MNRTVTATVALAASGSTTLGFHFLAARAMGVRDFGQLAQTLSVAMIAAQLTMAGVVPGAARWVASAPTHFQRLQRSAYATTRLWLVAAAGSAAFIAAVATDVAPSIAHLTLSGWVLALVYPVYFAAKTILFAINRVGLYAALELTACLTFFAVLLALLRTRPDLALFSFAIVYGAFALGATIWFRSFKSAQSRGVPRALAKYVSWASIATLTSIVRFPLAVALVGAIVGSEDAGVLALALSAVSVLLLLPQALGMLTFSDVARESPGSLQAQMLSARTQSLASLGTFGIAIFAISLGPLVVAAAGPAYSEASLAALVVAVGLYWQMVASPVAAALAAAGFVRDTAHISLLGMVVTTASVASLATARGAVGAAAGLALGSASSGVLTLVRARQRFHVLPRSLGVLWFPAAGTAIAAAAYNPAASTRVVLVLLLVSSAAVFFRARGLPALA